MHPCTYTFTRIRLRFFVWPESFTTSTPTKPHILWHVPSSVTVGIPAQLHSSSSESWPIRSPFGSASRSGSKSSSGWHCDSSCQAQHDGMSHYHWHLSPRTTRTTSLQTLESTDASHLGCCRRPTPTRPFLGSKLVCPVKLALVLRPCFFYPRHLSFDVLQSSLELSEPCHQQPFPAHLHWHDRLLSKHHSCRHVLGYRTVRSSVSPQRIRKSLC